MTPGDGVAVSLSVYTQNILTMTQQLRPRGSFLCEGRKKHPVVSHGALGRTVSRVMSESRSSLGDHLSSTTVAGRIKRST